MARCARCGNEKLTEQPCPCCGFRKNADEVIPMPDRQTIIGRLLNVVADQDNEIDNLKEHIANEGMPMPPIGQGIVGCEDVGSVLQYAAVVA